MDNPEKSPSSRLVHHAAGDGEVGGDWPAELEAAAAVVYEAMPPTPQYRWPLLDARCGAEVWVKHENHTPVGAFKVRGGLVYFDALRARRAGGPGRRRGDARQPRAVVGVCRARATASRRPSSCRTATASRRTPPCARSASS